jgi:hypothetical protein
MTSLWIDCVIRLWARALVHAAGVELHGEPRSPRSRAALHPRLQSPQLCRHPVHPHGGVVAADPLMAGQSLQDPDLRLASAAASFPRPQEPAHGREVVRPRCEPYPQRNTIVIFPRRDGRAIAMKCSSVAFLRDQIAEDDRADGADSTFDIRRSAALQDPPRQVTLRVGTPIATENLTVRDKDRPLNESREQIETMLFPTRPGRGGCAVAGCGAEEWRRTDPPRRSVSEGRQWYGVRRYRFRIAGFRPRCADIAAEAPHPYQRRGANWLRLCRAATARL